MSDREDFFDTNIILYLLSGDAAKADRAEDLLAQGETISTQVLNEFASVAARKLRMPWQDIREVLQQVRSVCKVEPLTLQTHDKALQIAERHGFSFYDALIISAALLAGCRTLHSEDMQHSQIIDGRLTIHNPFVAP